MPQPTVGRVLHYSLSQNDVEQINRRRTTSHAIRDHIDAGRWPQGAQAHIGNVATIGDVVPLLVVRVWPDECGPGQFGVNGQAMLDGTDSLWVTSVCEGTEPGTWMWPPRVE